MKRRTCNCPTACYNGTQWPREKVPKHHKSLTQTEEEETMNTRAMSLAVVILVAVNAALKVIGEVIPGCTQYRVVYEPILCVPDQPTENCSANTRTHTTEKQWLIQISLDGKRKASSPNQTYPQYPNAPPQFVWHSKEEDVIVPTGAVCGGRYVQRFPGYFGTQPTQDPELYAIQQPDVLAECSNEYDCYWVDSLISGYKECQIDPLGGDPYMAFVSDIYAIHLCETELVSTSPAMRITWRDAYWGECWSE